MILPRLYAIADAAFGDPVALAADLAAGGARAIQVRNKNAAARELLEQVQAVIRMAPPDCMVIVNDRPDVALIAGAAGVHLGQQDLAPYLARRILLPGQRIGISTHNLAQALDADLSAADYIAVGPVFPTATKANADPVVGLELLREICSRVAKPVVAIGGITIENARDVFACGAASVAVVSDLFKTGDPSRRAREWLRVAGS